MIIHPSIIMNADSILDPSLPVNPRLISGEIKVGLDGDKIEGQELDAEKNNEFVRPSERIEDVILDGESEMVHVDLEGELQINMMGNGNGFFEAESESSLQNNGGEYSEQDYSEQDSEDGDISVSEYSDDEDDPISIEENMDEVEALLSTQANASWMSNEAPIPTLQSSSYSAAPTYFPPPTPVLSLAPLFPPGVARPSATAMSFFDNPTRYAIRINARKVIVHDTFITWAEHYLRQLPGMLRRTSRVPTSLRRCWVPYDDSDEYLDNTLVAIHDYGVEVAAMEKGKDVAKNRNFQSHINISAGTT